MKKGLFSKLLIVFIIVANVIFTNKVLDVVAKSGVEPSALVTSWFGFTTIELVNMAFIKSKKVKNKEEKRDGDL